MKISDSIHGNQSCDIGVGSTGRVWVAWRQFEFKKQQADAVAYVYSTDGGRSFTKPALATEFVRWDMGDTAGDPGVRAGGLRGVPRRRRHARTLRGPDPRVNTRDCGDGPFECRSGYVFGRATRACTSPPTRLRGRPDAAYALVDATVPGTETATGTSYSTITDGVGSQASTYMARTSNGGGSWTVSRQPATKGPPVLQRRRRVRRAAARRLPRHAQRHGDRPPGTVADFRPSRSRISGSAEQSARRTRIRASRRSTPARPTAGRRGRISGCRASATRSTTSSSATATSPSSGTTTTSPPRPRTC